MSILHLVSWFFNITRCQVISPIAKFGCVWFHDLMFDIDFYQIFSANQNQVFFLKLHV